jgi:hypothetical protein
MADRVSLCQTPVKKHRGDPLPSEVIASALF